MRFQHTAISLACATLLVACGGGGGGTAGGKAQSVDFQFPDARYLLTPAAPLVATASSGLPVTFTSNTPTTCTIDGNNLVTVAAGECSITATQAGDSTYMAVSSKQLFNVLKHTQWINFPSPGFQSILQTPPPLVATSETGLPVTFTSTTPDICTTSGTALVLVSKGNCAITASQPGNDLYEAATAKNVFLVGDDTPPVLTLMSGFASDGNQTLDGNDVGTFAGSNVDGWWCSDANWCGKKLNADGSLAFHYVIQPNDPAHPNSESQIFAYTGIEFYAPGVANYGGILKTGDTTAGVKVGLQNTIKLSVGENDEWFKTTNHDVRINLSLGHYHKKNDGGDCNVTLTATFTPTVAALGTYEVQLASFNSFDQSCDLANLNPADELAKYPIVKVQVVAAASNTSVLGTPAVPKNFPTVLTLAGPITLQ
jgi:hypothetical protein